MLNFEHIIKSSTLILKRLLINNGFYLSFRVRLNHHFTQYNEILSFTALMIIISISNSWITNNIKLLLAPTFILLISPINLTIYLYKLTKHSATNFSTLHKYFIASVQYFRPNEIFSITYYHWRAVTLSLKDCCL